MIRRHLGFHALLASFQCQDGRRMKKAYVEPLHLKNNAWQYFLEPF